MNTKWRIIILFYMLVLAFVSLRAGGDPSTGTTIREVAHNALHIPAYSLLTYLLLRGCKLPTAARAQIFAFSAAVLFGLVLEIFQMYVPNRYPSIGDVILNAIGAGIIIFLYKRILIL